VFRVPFDPEQVSYVTIISRDEGVNILDIPIGEDVTEVSCTRYGFAPCIAPTATPSATNIPTNP